MLLPHSCVLDFGDMLIVARAGMAGGWLEVGTFLT